MQIIEHTFIMEEKSTFSFYDPLKVTIFVSYKIKISFI